MKSPDDIRKDRNKDLVERLKAGDPLNSPMDHVDTWWPPRPIIEKDVKEIKRVYRIEVDKDE